MTFDSRHFDDELQELIDGSLDAETRVNVERHLSICDQCSSKVNALQWTRNLYRQNDTAAPTPVNLQENILAALDLEDRISRISETPSKSAWPRQRYVLAFGLVVSFGIVLTIVAFVLVPSAEPIQEIVLAPEIAGTPAKPLDAGLPDLVTRDFRDYISENLTLSLTTQDVGRLERFFVAENLSFETRVFDLRMMKYRLVGGRVHQLNNSESALFVYSGTKGETLLCQMYKGQVVDLSPAVEVRVDKGIKFYIYNVNGITSIFWQEGDIACVLTSDISAEDLIGLAFAKAVKV